MAEGRRFELLVPCGTAVFKTAPLDHSGTPPAPIKHTGGRRVAQAGGTLGALDCPGVTVLSGLLPVFLILALGVAARRFGLVDGLAAAGLNRLVANLALPAFLVSEIGTSTLRVSFSPRLVGAVLTTTVVVTVLALGAGLLMRLPASQRGVLAQAAMRGNVAYVGFPVILAALGEAGLRRAAITAALLIPLMSLIAVSVLEQFRTQHDRAGLLLFKVLGNPLVVASLLGLLLAAVEWHPWSWLARTLRVLADFALPAALLALGAQLEFRQWHGVWRATVVAAVVKQLVTPVLGLIVLRALGTPHLEMSVGVLMLAAPTAIATYPVAAELGGDTDLAGACVLVTTAAAFVVFAGWSLLLGL